MGTTMAKRPRQMARARTTTQTVTRPMRAIVWNPKRALLSKGGTMIFVSGKGKQAARFERYGPIQGHGLKFERGLARTLGVEQGKLHAYLEGRTLYGVAVHSMLYSTDRDRKTSAQAKA